VCWCTILFQGCSKLNFCGNVGKCVDGQLNYFRATGQNDSLHYVWSTVGYPTLFISRSAFVNSSDCTSSIHVNDYSEFKNHQSPGSVSIDGAKSNFSFALVFKSIIDFQVDSKKLPTTSAFNPNQNYYTSVDLSDLSWSPYSFHDGTIGMDVTNMSVTLLVSVLHADMTYHVLIRSHHELMIVMKKAMHRSPGSPLTQSRLTWSSMLILITVRTGG